MQQRPARLDHSPRRGRPAVRLVAAAAALAVTGLAVPASPVAHADPIVTINLVTVNDFHGRIERDGAAAGAAALSTAVKQIRATNPNTVFAAAGDLIGASTFTSFIQQDKPTIDALNAAGLEVSAVGNHEFDQGYSDLINRVVPLANWEYLGANVHPTDGSPALPEYWTQTFDGVTIGFVGAVTDELPSLVSPAGIANLSIEAPVAAANRVADQLSDGNPANGEADIVVLLVHEGAVTTDISSATDPNTRFGKIVLGADSNIDAIVSGHTHLAYNHVINGRPVISSGQYGERFSNMTINYDKADGTFTMNNVIINATAAPGFADDPAVASIVAAAKATADVLGAVKLGNVTADFRRAKKSDGSENRGGESTLGNFVADVQLWAANQFGAADIAFMNPGGLRADLAYGTDGTVTYKGAANVQPFANTLNTLTLTGAQVKTVLEQQWQPAGASRPFLKLGVNKELDYVYDPTAPAGSHVTRITLNGVPIDPNAQYRIVANSFLAAGGDNFTELAKGTNKVDTGKIDLQSMVDWFAANQVASPDVKQRAIGIHLSPPDADGYDVGDTITIDLSSLDFSQSEPKAGTVQVSLGGKSLGTFPVDPTPVTIPDPNDPTKTIPDSYDEIGRAHIVTTIPAGLYGVKDLVVTVPSTGSTATLPVALDKGVTMTQGFTFSPWPRAGSTVVSFVRVAGPLRVTGSITIKLDGVEVKTVNYMPHARAGGWIVTEVKLPRTLKRGLHQLTFTYNGTDELAASSDDVTIRVR